MSITVQQIIDQALYNLGYLEKGEAADATDSADALRVLNQMMAEWEWAGKDLNWFAQDTLSDTMPIPAWSERAVMTSLALDCAGEFDVIATQALYTKFDEARQTLTNRLINTALNPSDMSHLSRGSGHYDIETDNY